MEAMETGAKLVLLWFVPLGLGLFSLRIYELVGVLIAFLKAKTGPQTIYQVHHTKKE